MAVSLVTADGAHGSSKLLVGSHPSHYTCHWPPAQINTKIQTPLIKHHMRSGGHYNTGRPTDGQLDDDCVMPSTVEHFFK